MTNLPQIYTDGSCLKNPGGASGWCFCLIENNQEFILSGGEFSSTNNRMELMAVNEALNFVQGKEYEIYTDNMDVRKYRRSAKYRVRSRRKSLCRLHDNNP